MRVRRTHASVVAGLKSKCFYSDSPPVDPTYMSSPPRKQNEQAQVHCDTKDQGTEQCRAEQSELYTPWHEHRSNEVTTQSTKHHTPWNLTWIRFTKPGRENDQLRLRPVRTTNYSSRADWMLVISGDGNIIIYKCRPKQPSELERWSQSASNINYRESNPTAESRANMLWWC